MLRIHAWTLSLIPLVSSEHHMSSNSSVNGPPKSTDFTHRESISLPEDRYLKLTGAAIPNTEFKAEKVLLSKCPLLQT